MDDPHAKPMPKEIRGVTSLSYIRYLETYYPHISIDDFLEGIVASKKYQALNPESGILKPITKEFLLDPDNWVSHDVFGDLIREGRELTDDPLFSYKGGRNYFAISATGPKKTVMKLMGVRNIIKRIPEENDKLNRTKSVEVVENGKGHAKVRLHWKKSIDNEYIRDGCANNRGVYEALGTLTGNPATVTEICCAANGAPYCEFDISWRPEPFFARVGSLLKAWIASDLIEELEENEKKNIELIRNQEEIIDSRTKQLKQAQSQLIDAEKRTLEHRITGGFAHEMRNALAGAQLEFKTTLNYKDQGKPSAEILKESATKLLKNISDLHEEFQIPRKKIATLLLPELKTIAEISDHLAGVHADVSHDLDRGLSITTQIRDYARKSELKPGDEPIDIVPLLKNYGDRYRQSFERIGITYSFEGLNQAIVKADETHINSIFSNLVLNAKDALEEQGAEGREQGAGRKEINVTVETAGEEEKGELKIKVRDNGPGIPEENLHEIFEPFYSTKPTTGTGLGLGVVKRLVQLYGGTIQVASQAGEGTTFFLSLPHDI